MTSLPSESIGKDPPLTRSGAYKVLWKAVDGRQADAVEQHRAMELQRLDALQMGLWDRAEAGDVKAVLRIIEQRSRLLGLDTLGTWKAEPKTVVLRPDQPSR